MRKKAAAGLSSTRRRRLALAALALGAAMAVLLVAVGDDEVAEVAVEKEQEAGEIMPVQELDVRVLRRFPHDSDAFTQGLVIHDGVVYESTGLYGQSRVRSWELESGQVLAQQNLETELFGEGLALVEDELVQLTWKNGIALRWERDELKPRGQWSYDGEGWGLCFDGVDLVMSDGTQRLFFRDPESFDVLRTVTVTWRTQKVAMINELECAEGWIFANVLGREEIVRIDPSTGEITAVVDASGLLSPEERRGTDVLNGIAYREETGTFLLTGKHWPALFEVELVPPSGS